MSSTKKGVAALVAVLALIVAYWLISPLFIKKEVHESMDDLLRMAGVQRPDMTAATPPSEQPSLQLPANTPPAGKDPKTESKGPTAPPPGPAAIANTVGMGAFEGQAGHNGSGTAELLRIGDAFYVRLEENFSVTNGPDLYVGFGKDGKYEQAIAPLKGNIGSQNYEIPAGIDAASYNEIWIWCRAFSVPFARAVLR